MVEGFASNSPDKWELVPFGFCCEKVSVNYSPANGSKRPYLGLEHLSSGFPSYTGIGKEDDVKSTKYAFSKGDVLFGKLRPYLRKAVLARFEGICSTDIIVLRASDRVLPEYLIYLVHSDPFIEHAKKTTAGVQHPRTSWKSLRHFHIPLPTKEEQRRIAAILSTVQRAIELQEQLTARTTELKKALMHKLFTDGTRGEPRKMTAIGPVPVSWEVAALGEQCTIQTGIAKGRKIDPEDAVTLPYLRVANVQDGFLDLSELKEITIRKSEVERFSLKNGDVVLTEGGDLDKLGRGFIWDGHVDPCVHQNHVFAVRPKTPDISSEFLAFQIQSPYGKAYFLSVAHKTTNLACINTSKLKSFPLLIPSALEQKEIVETLSLVDKKKQICDRRLDAYKSLFRALLNQLMTAQIRVRDVDLSELGLTAGKEAVR